MLVDENCTMISTSLPGGGFVGGGVVVVAAVVGGGILTHQSSTSSSCPQSVLPHPSNGQSFNDRSVPLHSTSSIQI